MNHRGLPRVDLYVLVTQVSLRAVLKYFFFLSSFTVAQTKRVKSAKESAQQAFITSGSRFVFYRAIFNLVSKVIKCKNKINHDLVA